MNELTIALGFLTCVTALVSKEISKPYSELLHCRGCVSIGRLLACLIGMVCISLGLYFRQVQSVYEPWPTQPGPKYRPLMLQQATIDQWLKASYPERQATAVEWIQRFRQQGKLELRVNGVNDFKPWATALNLCILARSKMLKNQQERVIGLAQTCTNKHLLRYLTTSSRL